MEEAPQATPGADAATPETGDEAKDWRAEAEKWQALARKNEDRAKANAAAAKELDEFRKAAMSDQERAVAEARAAGAAEVRAAFASRLVDAEVRAAAAGRPVDVDALLEGLDRSRFLTDDGEPDTKAIAAWVDRVAPVPEAGEPSFPDLGQGVRPTPAALALNGDPLLKHLKDSLGI